MSKYILMHGTFFAIEDNALCHIAKPNSTPQENHKYLKREWKNGRWEYTYKENKPAAKKKALINESSITTKQNKVNPSVAKANAAKQALINEHSKTDGGDKHQIQSKQNAAVKAQKEASAAIREEGRKEAEEKSVAKARAAVSTGKQVVENLTQQAASTIDTKTDDEKADVSEQKKTAVTTADEEKKKSGGGSGSGKKTDKLADAEKYQQEAQSDLEAAQAYYEEVLARFEKGQATQEEVDAAKARVDMFQSAVNTANADVEKIKSAKKKKKKKKSTTSKTSSSSTGTGSIATKSVKDASLDRYKKAAAEKVKRLLDAKEKREQR